MAPSHLSVVVVGGGVGGLVAASFLAKVGHKVTVIEQRPQISEANSLDAGQGLNLTTNAQRCLFALGLKDAFLNIADCGMHLQVKRFSDGSMLRTTRTLNGHAMVHRADLLRLLRSCVSDAGVESIHGQSFDRLEEGVDEGVRVHLRDGRCLSADLVIGADGIHSQVRSSIPSIRNAQPRLTGDCTFLVDVPASIMVQHESTRTLYKAGKDPFQFWMGPERSVVGWTMTRHERYHLQMNDHAYGSGEVYGECEEDGGAFVKRFENMDAFRRRWSNFEPAIRYLLSQTKAVTRWKTAELPDLSCWSSLSGRVILLGDAAHALPPFAGQGAAMAIEDATALGTLLGQQYSETDLPAVAKAYETLRRPRIDGFRQIIASNVRQWSIPDAKTQEEDFQQRIKSTRDQGEQGGVWSTEQRYRWVDEYDAILQASKYCFDAKL